MNALERVMTTFESSEFPTLVILHNVRTPDSDLHLPFRLMNEPRGHYDMYGAILVQETEMAERGAADIGVLFCHNGESLVLQARCLFANSYPGE